MWRLVISDQTPIHLQWSKSCVASFVCCVGAQRWPLPLSSSLGWWCSPWPLMHRVLRAIHASTFRWSGWSPCHVHWRLVLLWHFAGWMMWRCKEVTWVAYWPCPLSTCSWWLCGHEPVINLARGIWRMPPENSNYSIQTQKLVQRAVSESFKSESLLWKPFRPFADKKNCTSLHLDLGWLWVNVASRGLQSIPYIDSLVSTFLQEFEGMPSPLPYTSFVAEDMSWTLSWENLQKKTRPLLNCSALSSWQ